ncbi:odorant receptor 46a isoform X4 [Drosophila sulfurigaster albostrigata]|uniref:odorant receptor 46a isoform X4 n=1 Tax=Drosophila sulfurigaster albostrigata TaxID=89887 RepID=UPI002D21BC37|nr:odorant receptor 46a isoform X4 [Drosophila sulfurigaster albostrigata]
MNRAEHREITESFYKYQVRYFEILGLWQLRPDATKRQQMLHLLRYLLFLGIVSVMLVFFAIHVLANIDQLTVIMQVFFLFATEMSCMVKLLSIRLRRREHAQLLDEMHSSVFRPRTAEETLTFKGAAQMAINMRNYYGAMSIQAAALLLVMQWFVDSSALPLALLNFLRAQLVMLSMRLENLGAALTPLDDHRIAKELRECCVYYARIERLRDMVDGFIKIPGSVQLFCTILVLVSNFYEMSTHADETAFIMKIVTYQFAMLLQIFIVCNAANEVTYQSSLLGHTLYNSEWTTWNKDNRKMCLLMMLRFDDPLWVRTINHTQSFSLPTFSSIVNCSYSYFALLKRVNS